MGSTWTPLAPPPDPCYRARHMGPLALPQMLRLTTPMLLKTTENSPKTWLSQQKNCADHLSGREDYGIARARKHDSATASIANFQ